MARSKKCNNCRYYAEEYALYVHAVIPVCNYKGDYKCVYVRNDIDYNTKGRKDVNEQANTFLQ